MDKVRFIELTQAQYDSLPISNGQLIFTNDGPGLSYDILGQRHKIEHRWEEPDILPDWDSRGLNYNSWETIYKYTKAGQLSEVATVEDTKQLTLSNGQTLNMQLVAINDGTGTAGEYYPANTADFISKECLTSSVPLSSTNSSSGGWHSCQGRTFLNTTVLGRIPSDIQNYIVAKKHLRTIGGSSSELIEDSDLIWLPTAKEIGELPSSGYVTYETFDFNKRYAGFDTPEKLRKRVNGVDYGWFFSTPLSSENYYWTGVVAAPGSSQIPYVGRMQGNDPYAGSPLCFRIGK